MTMPSTSTLSHAEARRIALAAQAMASGSRPPATATWRRISSAIERMNLLQIDSVNVVARSHYLPVLARVGHYKPHMLDTRLFNLTKRELFEHWAHEASLLPMRFYPLLQWRTERARNNDGIYKELVRFAAERSGYLERVRDQIRHDGPVRAADLPEAKKDAVDWWSWSPAKTALEYLFATGEVTAAGRQGNFERLYDIPERVIPAEFLNCPRPSEPDAIRELVRLSAAALGIATEPDIRDYFRLPLAPARRAVRELTEVGELQPVEIERWQQPAYLWPSCECPRRATASALLSPFDPLVWNRGRAERIFNFTYRIEIYTPAAKRQYGYYVLPFLMNGHLVGRVCLKSDRQNGMLRVNASHVEDRQPSHDVADGLADALAQLATFLGLSGIEVSPAGNLSTELTSAIRKVH
jgi:uncharacterized protein YcaQ